MGAASLEREERSRYTDAMKFSIEETLPHPFDAVYTTYRDKLPTLVPYLPDIRSIEVIEREKKGKKLRLVNKWVASTEVPAAVRKIIDLKEVSWLDHAEWDDEDHVVQWRFEIPVLRDYVTAEGTNEFREAKGGTRLVLAGEFRIDVSNHPRVPRLLARVFQPQMEKFIFALIKPNLTAVNRGLDKFLSEQEKKGRKK